MLQSSIFRALLEQLATESDPERRAALMHQAERQYDLDLEHQSNFVQTRIGNLELDIREQVATSLGATNEMIGQSVAEGRELRTLLEGYFVANTAAMEGLRTETQSGFRRVDARLEEVGTNVEGLSTRVDAHDAQIASFQASREESIRERKEIRDDVNALAGRLDAFMSRIDALIADSPAIERDERTAMLSFLRRLMAREAGGHEG